VYTNVCNGPGGYHSDCMVVPDDRTGWLIQSIAAIRRDMIRIRRDANGQHFIDQTLMKWAPVRPAAVPIVVGETVESHHHRVGVAAHAHADPLREPSNSTPREVRLTRLCARDPRLSLFATCSSLTHARVYP
jgi:hypothetical protein